MLMGSKYGNTRQDDLWSSLSDAAHVNRVLPSPVDIKVIMNTWTLQVGYPIITITRVYDQRTAFIKQVCLHSLRLKKRKKNNLMFI